MKRDFETGGGIANFQLRSTGNIRGMALPQICNRGSRGANSKNSFGRKLGAPSLAFCV